MECKLYVDGECHDLIENAERCSYKEWKEPRDHWLFWVYTFIQRIFYIITYPLWKLASNRQDHIMDKDLVKEKRAMMQIRNNEKKKEAKNNE